MQIYHLPQLHHLCLLSAVLLSAVAVTVVQVYTADNCYASPTTLKYMHHGSNVCMGGALLSATRTYLLDILGIRSDKI